MSRHAQQLQTPGQPTFEGDSAFTGLNMKVGRDQLPAGFVARHENRRFVGGSQTRAGAITPRFANVMPAMQAFKGSGLYSDPNGEEMGLIAAGTGLVVFAIRSGTYPTNITVAAPGFTSDVEFVQHFQNVLAHQKSPDGVSFIWNGLSSTTGFVPVTGPTVEAPGLAVLPKVPWSINFQGRAWFPIPDSPDEIGASDINDPTTYDSILHQFRINTGMADKIVGIYPYLGSNLIIGKTGSMQLMSEIPGDLGDSFLLAIQLSLAPASAPPPRVTSISNSIGIAGRKSVVMAGSRFMFLSPAGSGGIFQIIQDGNNLAVDPIPVSDAIEPLIKRINWEAADGAVGILDGIYASWAVPLDGCSYNNARLVYNLATSQWEGLDWWGSIIRDPALDILLPSDSPMRMDNLIYLDYYGRKKVYAINHTSYVVHVLEMGTYDQLGGNGIASVHYSIQDLLETRGYSTMGWLATSARETKRVEMMLQTNDPVLKVYQVMDDSISDDELLGDLMVNRLKYTDALKADFNPTNINNDYNRSHREDYKILLGDNFMLQSGVRVERMRVWTWRHELTARVRYISFRVHNVSLSGECGISNIILESVGSPRMERIA